MKPEKASEGKPVGDLILQLLVAEIEEALNNQGLEHQNHIQRLAPAGLFRSALRKASVKTGRNISKSIRLPNSSSGSFKRLNAARRWLSSKKETWYDFI
jgi:hypothetical protein